MDYTQPASKLIICLVIFKDCSDAKNKTNFAGSSGLIFPSIDYVQLEIRLPCQPNLKFVF